MSRFFAARTKREEKSMRFWNFTHGLHLHVYYFLALAILLTMIICRLIQRKNQKKRDKDAEEHLKEVEEEISSSTSQENNGETEKTEDVKESEEK